MKKKHTNIHISPTIMFCDIDRKHYALFVFGNAKWVVKSETSNFTELSLKTEKNIIFPHTKLDIMLLNLRCLTLQIALQDA